MAQTYFRVTNLADVTGQQPTYLAIGSFDGVHRGHQAVIRSLVQQARGDGARAAVLTFFPHPKRVVLELNGQHYLNTLDERVALIGRLGVDLIITHPFNETVRLTRATDFIEQLCLHLNMRQLWGGNFALGYQREGTVDYLQQLGQEKGYTVELVANMVEWEGKPVSSTRIRHFLEAGDVAAAAACLGYRYRLCGQVVRGNQLGHTIGFPTANLSVWDEQLLPAHGVYAAYAWLGEQRLETAVNIGLRPTVGGQHVRIEAHLLDFSGDLYDKELCLTFVQRIRSEMKFPSLQALQAQIQQDVETARSILAVAPPEA
ncbi:MAG: bifunctional riboflavin kinase/FAD synthetase [Ardenticatenaceae bacterium]|nr:bifunctional riboflavin kinase/FAD synthetase [Ardenticatenaceae bacterium]